MLRHLVEHYSPYVSPYQKAKVVSYAKSYLHERFDFKILSLLINYNAKLTPSIVEQLKGYLQNLVAKDEAAKNTMKPFEAFPKDEPLYELNQVGYWCFLGSLKRMPFSEFLGKSDMFDFYYLFACFDFSRFNISWLIYSSEKTLALISKNKTVRRKIRERIAEELQNGNISKRDEARLTKILSKYFC